MSQKRRLRSTPNLTSVYASLIPFPTAPIRSRQLEVRSRRLGLCSRRRSLPRGRPLIPRAPKSQPQRLQSPLPASCSSTCHLLADWLSWCRLPVSSADRACSPSTALLPRLSNFTCSPSSSSRSRTSARLLTLLAPRSPYLRLSLSLPRLQEAGCYLLPPQGCTRSFWEVSLNGCYLLPPQGCTRSFWEVSLDADDMHKVMVYNMYASSPHTDMDAVLEGVGHT